MRESSVRHNIIEVEYNYGLLSQEDHEKIDSESTDGEEIMSVRKLTKKSDIHKMLV